MTTRDSDDEWLSEAVATRDLDRLEPNMAAAGDRVNDARNHVRSARTIAADDSTLAIAACHDAIRKAITGHMIASGFRPKRGEGSHKIVLLYARHRLVGPITEQDLEDADTIRKDRGTAEYGDFASSTVDAEYLEWAAGVAQRIVDAVAGDLAARSKRSTAPRRRPR